VVVVAFEVVAEVVAVVVVVVLVAVVVGEHKMSLVVANTMASAVVAEVLVCSLRKLQGRRAHAEVVVAAVHVVPADTRHLNPFQLAP
jgi:hypothetical protein